jgi:hypothetical protein
LARLQPVHSQLDLDHQPSPVAEDDLPVEEKVRELNQCRTKHQLPRGTAEPLLRQLEPLACRRSEGIDDAVRRFRERNAETRKP